MHPDKENRERTAAEKKEYEDGRKNPHGFRSKVFGTAEEIAAFEEGQKAGRSLEEGENPEDNKKDDLESKR
jgi:hypothetical protein